jgi:hypothetical protein
LPGEGKFSRDPTNTIGPEQLPLLAHKRIHEGREQKMINESVGNGVGKEAIRRG